MAGEPESEQLIGNSWGALYRMPPGCVARRAKNGVTEGHPPCMGLDQSTVVAAESCSEDGVKEAKLPCPKRG